MVLDKSGGGSELADGLGDFVGDIGELLPFAGGYPGEMYAAGFDADVFEQILEHGEAPPSVVVAAEIMAIAGMASGDEDAVPAFL